MGSRDLGVGWYALICVKFVTIKALETSKLVKLNVPRNFSLKTAYLVKQVNLVNLVKTIVV